MIELLFDIEFGLSGSEISEDEGENTYCYRGEASLSKESVEDFGNKLVSSPLASLWMNRRAIEQLEILSRGR